LGLANTVTMAPVSLLAVAREQRALKTRAIRLMRENRD